MAVVHGERVCVSSEFRSECEVASLAPMREVFLMFTSLGPGASLVH